MFFGFFGCFVLYFAGGAVDPEDFIDIGLEDVEAVFDFAGGEEVYSVDDELFGVGGVGF